MTLRLAVAITLTILLLLVPDGLREVVPPCAVLHGKVVCLPGIALPGRVI